MKLTSPAFAANGRIPERFSQNDVNHSVPLDFAEVPAGTVSLALIMDDPDAPNGTFTHWVVFNIDPHSRGLPENYAPLDVRMACNDQHRPEYTGPKPPDGEHRYFFHLYALDCQLDLPHGTSREAVEQAMAGHQIDEAQLVGRYATPAMVR
jgi:Raf kinase inhibitor-like YbhB/YbcL family protein